jgi:hypothetical protein
MIMPILLYEPVYWDDRKSFISHPDEKAVDAREAVFTGAFTGGAYNVVITKTKYMSDFGEQATGGKQTRDAGRPERAEPQQ